MSKCLAIVLTATVCLPLGALLRSSASAQPRRDDMAMGVALDGHLHLTRARLALRTAVKEIAASQQANEGLWSFPVRGKAAKVAIENASHIVEETADWVRAGESGKLGRVPRASFILEQH